MEGQCRRRCRCRALSATLVAPLHGTELQKTNREFGGRMVHFAVPHARRYKSRACSSLTGQLEPDCDLPLLPRSLNNTSYLVTHHKTATTQCQVQRSWPSWAASAPALRSFARRKMPSTQFSPIQACLRLECCLWACPITGVYSRKRRQGSNSQADRIFCRP